MSLKFKLKSLESFREIMRLGSATAAGRAVGLSQPAVSRLLGQLERELGFPVFHRQKGRLVATPQALLLFEEVDLAFKGLERVNALVDDINNLEVGRLRVVAPPSFAEGPLVVPIMQFVAGRPDIKFSIDSRSRPTTMNLIATRTADCGFGKLPIENPRIRCRPLVATETMCAIKKGHPLLARKVIGPRDLQDQPLILIGQGGEPRLRIEEAFRAAGVRPQVRLETHHVGAACAFAGQGLGIAIVNELLATNYRRYGIECRLFRPRIRQEYVFMTSAEVPSTPLTEAFYQHCRKAFSGRASVT
ncbi:MAG: LysR family transcriptional regulator [Steroidobacteraceae bacterium]